MTLHLQILLAGLLPKLKDGRVELAKIFGRQSVNLDMFKFVKGTGPGKGVTFVGCIWFTAFALLGASLKEMENLLKPSWILVFLIVVARKSNGLQGRICRTFGQSRRWFVAQDVFFALVDFRSYQ